MYIPRYHILRRKEIVEARENGELLPMAVKLGGDEVKIVEYIGTYVIPETEFIAVRSYRSKHISETKSNFLLSRKIRRP